MVERITMCNFFEILAVNGQCMQRSPQWGLMCVQAQGGLVVAMMLKTSRGGAVRAAAAGCLMKLLPQLTPLERQILWSIYPNQLPAPATGGAT